MPMAVHELAEAQDTPSRSFPVEPAGFGVAWIFQDALTAGEPAADPAPVAASAVPASMRTYPMAKVTVTTTAITAKRLAAARLPLWDSMMKCICPPGRSIRSVGLGL